MAEAAPAPPSRGRADDPSDSSVLSAGAQVRRSQRIANAIVVAGKESAREYRTRSRKTADQLDASVKSMATAADTVGQQMGSIIETVRTDLATVVSNLKTDVSAFVDGMKVSIRTLTSDMKKDYEVVDVCLDAIVPKISEATQSSNTLAGLVSGMAVDTRKSIRKVKEASATLLLAIYLAIFTVLVSWVALAFTVFSTRHMESIGNWIYLLYLLAASAGGLALGSFLTIYKQSRVMYSDL